MLGIESANLPSEEQKRLHPEFLANEQDYLRMRDGLIPKYHGQWVAVDKGQVVASGHSLLDVMRTSSARGGHAFVACVGKEDEVIARFRRAVYPYDANYAPTALPRITALFLNYSETCSQSHADAIADTGADLTLLPDVDCRAINLYASPSFTMRSAGAFGPVTTARIYHAKVEIDGRRLDAMIQPVLRGTERIVGRDVLNQLRVLFDGPKTELTVDP